MTAAVHDGRLRVHVADDGIGGARATGANGLVGLEDRVSVIGGQLVVGSPSGRGTRIKCDVAPGEGIIRYSPSAIATPASAPAGLRWLDTYQGQRGLSQARDENDAPVGRVPAAAIECA